MVAALFVDLRNGPYPGVVGEHQCWGIDRDATMYDGPCPVVAHPPCADWGGLRHFAKPPPGRKECAPVAVDIVRRFGGILEHPAGSKLWAYCGLPVPGEPPLPSGEYTIEVDQSWWGHPARKRTWLLIAGGPVLPPLPPPKAPTHVVAPARGTREANRGRHLPKSKRHLTPPAFARWLVSAVESIK